MPTFLAYSARQALRRIDDWTTATRGLDSSDAKIRGGLLLAMEGVYDVAAAALADFAASIGRPAAERVKAIKYLTAVDRKAPPWDGKWWGTQPAQGKPPTRTIAWEGTPRVMATIRTLVTDREAIVRAGAVEAVAATSHRDSLPLFRSRFRASATSRSRRNLTRFRRAGRRRRARPPDRVTAR